MLFGKLERGGIVQVKIENGKPVFDYPDPNEPPAVVKKRKGKQLDPVR